MNYMNHDLSLSTFQVSGKRQDNVTKKLDDIVRLGEKCDGFAKNKEVELNSKLSQRWKKKNLTREENDETMEEDVDGCIGTCV